MEYAVNFGHLRGAAAPAPRGKASRFRLAVLGDFSGGAVRAGAGAALSARRPHRVDADNLDAVVARLAPVLRLDLGDGAGTVDVPLGGLDDFHPDQLVENVPLFAELRQLRRDLGSRTGFERAATTVLGWSGAAALPPPPREGRGDRVATDRRLSDFASLLRDRPEARTAPADVDDDATAALLRRLVGPFVVPAPDKRQDRLVAAVDEAMTAAMRRLLHHPDFQAAEAAWRGVDLLVRRIETGARCEIVLFDVSAAELAADLAATDALADTGLHDLLVAQPALDAGAGPFSAVLGLYGFEATPPHAELLGRLARLAAAAGAPFIAGIGPDALRTPLHEQHRLVADSWTALTELGEANYLGLATPRFLLRLPYGKRSDPIDSFPFEEFSRQEGLAGMLWSHPAVLPGLLLAQSWAREGVAMQPGGVLTAGDMPYFTFRDDDGEAVALPCTERLYGEREAAALRPWHVMPVLTLRGRPDIRLGGFTSVAGGKLAGFWAPVAIVAAEAEPPPVVAPAVPEPAPEPIADAAPSIEAAVATERTGTTDDAPADAAAPAAADDLDALLASLGAPPPTPEPDATEPDLEALLASLGA